MKWNQTSFIIERSFIDSGTYFSLLFTEMSMAAEVSANLKMCDWITFIFYFTSLYTDSKYIDHIIHHRNISFHCYADDTQLFLSI